MAASSAASPRFAFSRRDPSAIVRLVDARLRAGKGVRVLALGGQPRDRVYCAQLLAGETGQAFVQLDLGLGGRAAAEEKAALEKILAFARSTPTTLYLEGAESLFEASGRPPGERARTLGDYLRRSLAVFAGTVVFGMPERVEADYGRLPAIDAEVTFRAPSGNVIAGRPLLLPSYRVDEIVLPGHRFQVEIDGVEIGVCAVDAPALIAGPYSEHEFAPSTGPNGFAAQPPDARAAWPTVTLRRAVTQSRLWFDWKQSQYGGKPLVRELTLHQLDWGGRRVVNSWMLKGCWAKRWRGPAFDAMRSAVADEELELYYSEVLWI